jgi:hypothetical protein
MKLSKYETDINTMSTITSYNTSDVYIDTSVVLYNGTTWIENPCSEISLSSVIFEDYMPDVDELKEMCEEYPGLDKAYENFKTFYKLVEQDWRGKQKNNEP